ncbi:MAG TPA: NPCBM/NEW2 domain-containing protein [Cytophagaceae bacterium]|jgi:hypothetical protein
MKITKIILLCLSAGHTMVYSQNIMSGADWKDTDGKLIEAHGGGIMKHKEVYYWYGEDKSKGNFNKTGVSGYKSKDFIHWSNIGIVLKAESMPDLFKASTQGDAVLERPKVIYNSKTKKFIMWMHLDANTYTAASAGVAIADKPEGPFKFLHSFRPIAFKYKYNLPRGEEYSSKEAERGNTFRDMNLFLDENGKAYVFYSSEDNSTMYVSRLNSEFTDVEKPVIEGKTWSRILINQNREAPAPFKYNNKYYLITSGLTGWSPNAAQYALADSILGPYEIKGNPSFGLDANRTYGSQSTYVMKAPNSLPNTFIFMADRWNGTELEKSRYVWLPFTIKNDKVSILNIPEWDLSVFDTTSLAKFKASSFDITYEQKTHSLHWPKVIGAHLYSIIRNGEVVGSTGSTSFNLPSSLAGRSYQYNVIAQNVYQITLPSKNSLTIISPSNPLIYLNAITPDEYTQGVGILKYNTNMDEGAIVVAGKKYENGLGTHPPSNIKYNLGGNYKTLKITAGHSQTPNPSSKINFEIKADGQTVYKSPIMTEADEAVAIQVDLNNVQQIELIVLDGGDGLHYDHAAWLDGRLELK